MNRVALGVTAVAFGIGAFAFAGAASAHGHTETESCAAGIHADGNSYPGGHLLMTLTGATSIGKDFTGSYSETIPNPDKTTAHAWHIKVTSADHSGEFDIAGTIPACQTPPSTTGAPPSTLPTPSSTTGPVSTAPATTTPPPSSTSTPVTNPATSLPPATSTSVAATTSRPAPVTTAASVTTSLPPGTVSSVTPSTVAASLPPSTPTTVTSTTTTDGTLIHETIDRGTPKALPATGVASRVLTIIGFTLLGFGLILVFGVLLGKRLKKMQP